MEEAKVAELILNGHDKHVSLRKDPSSKQQLETVAASIGRKETILASPHVDADHKYGNLEVVELPQDIYHAFIVLEIHNIWNEEFTALDRFWYRVVMYVCGFIQLALLSTLYLAGSTSEIPNAVKESNSKEKLNIALLICQYGSLCLVSIYITMETERVTKLRLLCNKVGYLKKHKKFSDRLKIFSLLLASLSLVISIALISAADTGFECVLNAIAITMVNEVDDWLFSYLRSTSILLRKNDLFVYKYNKSKYKDIADHVRRLYVYRNVWSKICCCCNSLNFCICCKSDPTKEDIYYVKHKSVISGAVGTLAWWVIYAVFFGTVFIGWINLWFTFYFLWFLLSLFLIVMLLSFFFYFLIRHAIESKKKLTKFVEENLDIILDKEIKNYQEINQELVDSIFDQCYHYLFDNCISIRGVKIKSNYNVKGDKNDDTILFESNEEFERFILKRLKQKLA